jgi:hypothetical protein
MAHDRGARLLAAGPLDVQQLQGSGVQRDVVATPAEEHGTPVRDGIELVRGRHPLLREHRLVPGR